MCDYKVEEVRETQTNLITLSAEIWKRAKGSFADNIKQQAVRTKLLLMSNEVSFKLRTVNRKRYNDCFRYVEGRSFSEITEMLEYEMFRLCVSRS